jgi:hypothetical protein
VVERLEVAVRKEGSERAVANVRLEPGVGDGRRGVRGWVGNWEPVVEDGERRWDAVEVDGEVGLGIRGELWYVSEDH